VADSLHDSERWNAQVAVSENHQFVSRICECEYSEAVHISNWRPDRAIALLEAFKAMREALALSGQLVEEATHEVCTCDSNQTQSCRYCSKLSKSDSVSCAAMDAADKVLEELP